MSSSNFGIVRRLSLVMVLVAVLGPASLVPVGAKNGGHIINPLVPNVTPLNLNVTLHGAGATFPQPLIANWTVMYHRQFPNTTITYAGIGSGGGRNALWNKTTDFAASDAPLTPAQRLLAPGVLHIPETVGSVVLAYNLPGIPRGLNLTGPLIANIFLGNVHLWNDPAIQALNPHTILPNKNITTVHRSDGSGTTFIFTSYLTLESSAWASAVGAGTAVSWPGSPTCIPFPCFLTGNGNGGVATVITSNSFTFGYVELNFAIQNAMTYGFLKNPAGNFIEPTLASTNFAVGNSTSVLPTSGFADWSSVSLLDAPGAQTYPLASFTYILVFAELNVYPGTNLNETAQANALINLLRWMVHTGQNYASGLSYVPLHPNVVAIDDASINAIKYTIKSQPVHKTFSLSATGSGWSLSSISAASADSVTLLLSTPDSTNHQFYIDSVNNQLLDNNETSTASPVFTSSSGTVNFTFTPMGFNPASLPRFGSFTFRDKFNPVAGSGTFTLSNQQAAGPYPSRGSLTSGLLPVLDSSRVSLIGSFIIDLRTSQVSGNITLVAVDKTSGAVTYVKNYIIPNLGLGNPFILNAAVLPFDLGPITAGSLTPSYTMKYRELDVNGDGVINIVELATVGAAFGGVAPSYNGKADFNADGVIDIIDLVVVAGNFGKLQAFR